MNKNDELILEITDLDNNALGIGKASGFPIFVRHAVPGDIVRAAVTRPKKNLAYARIVEYIKKSPDRAEPECPVYKRCGGCQMQNMNYGAQLEFKQRRVRECLRRIGGFPEVSIEEIIGSEHIFRYRNKAQLPVGMNRDGRAICGFYAARTHEIIPCGDCLLSPPVFSEIASAVTGWMNACGIPAYSEETHTGIVRHIFIREGFHTGQLALCLVINSDRLPCEKHLLKALQPFDSIKSVTASVNKKRGNAILGDKILKVFGDDHIEEFIGGLKYKISPNSFFQVNPFQTERLYDKAIKFAALTGSETVIDLYCGTGTISLYAAKHAGKVYGIEISEQAVSDARQNAKINNISNAEFHAGAAEQILPKLYSSGLRSADVIITDPPRKGCDAQTLRTIIDISPSRIVYVSCDPATLARDLKYLCAKGYTLSKVQPVDMFPQTTHVETVVLMSRPLQ